MERQYQCLRCGHDSRTHECEQIAHAKMVALQRALDAEREKVKALEEQLRLANCDQANTEADLNDVTAQLAALQAQLAQPIRVCQGCGRVGRDGWVTARYECDELHGSLQCPDCQCIDLEINTAKELATLCTQAQAQLRQVEGANTKLRDALKTIEAIICDKKLCGHFLAEEIREQTQQARAAQIEALGQEGI